MNITKSVTVCLLLGSLFDRCGRCRPPLTRAWTLLQLCLAPCVRVEVHQVLLLDVKLQVDVRAEAFPTVKAEEWRLASVSYQVMLQTNRNLQVSNEKLFCLLIVNFSTLNGVSHSGQILFLAQPSPSMR